MLFFSFILSSTDASFRCVSVFIDRFFPKSVQSYKK